MQRLPPRRNAKKPTRRATQPTAPILDAAADAADSPVETNPFYEAALNELLAEFENGLQDHHELDAETREAMREQLKQLMADAAATSGGAAFNVPERSEWVQAVEALQKSGELKEDDARDLMRQLDEALAPLERRESKLAIEFSKRLSTEGEDSALAWLKQEAAKLTETQKTPAPATRQNKSSLRSEVVNSRSRRLRAPPRLG
jgi:hypothetical protein